MTHSLTIPNYLSPSLNQLIHCQWRKRAKLKKECLQLVTVYGRDIPRATGVRRVSLIFTLAPRNQVRDPDNQWKAVLDALVKCGLLIDDSREWCHLGAVENKRGKDRQTVVVLEDMEA